MQIALTLQGRGNNKRHRAYGQAVRLTKRRKDFKNGNEN